MKTMKKLLTAVLMVAMILSMGLTAFAEEETTYTVTINGAAQGSYSFAKSGIKYGDKVTVTINDSTVSVADSSKYYVKGLKGSGKDNRMTGSEMDKLNLVKSGDTYTITVKKDMDFVVSYGLKGSAVAYTVQYLDADGKELLPTETHYGDVGDKPVISYQYVDGYRPQAYNLTKTLLDDESANVITFRYSKVQNPTTTTVVVPGNGTASRGDGAPGADGQVVNGTGTAGQAGTNGTAGQTDATVNDANGGNAQSTNNDEPQQLIDLDDEDTPLANVTVDDSEGGSATKKLPIVAITGLSLAAIAAIAVLIFMKKKED